MVLKTNLPKLGVRCMPVIPTLGKLRQEDLEFEFSLNYKLPGPILEILVQ
jgi:hypothetical protein